MIYFTRTPLRVSFFGGGTDYPAYFEREKGSVIGLTIDKYIYIGLLKLTSHQNYNYRVSYSQIEICATVEDIQHPVVREVLRLMNISDRLDISIMSDLPASGSGLGSSSAFTVGFLNLVQSVMGKAFTKIELARQAIRVECEILQENVGVQDQLHATFGGLNRYDFHGSDIRISPIQLASDTMRALSESMVLIHTGSGRSASEIADEQVRKTKSKKIDADLRHLYDLVGECTSLLERGGDDFLKDMGKMLSESWYVKRSLTNRISDDEINETFNKIIGSGALGAKLCGAGGGGYFLALYPPDRQAALANIFGENRVVPVSIETAGSSLVYPNNNSQTW